MRRTLRRNCVHHRVTNAVAIVVANVFGNFLTITDLRRSGQKVPNGLFTIFENAISNKNATIPPEDVMNIVVQQFRGAVHTRYQIPRFLRNVHRVRVWNCCTNRSGSQCRNRRRMCIWNVQSGQLCSTGK